MVKIGCYVFLFFLTSTQVGCSLGQAPISAAAETPFNDIYIQPVADGFWRVELSFPHALENYVFRRTPGIPIRENWQVLTDGVVLVREGQRDVLRMDTAIQRVQLKVPSDDRLIRADYSLSQTFEHGNGVVFYSGHFIGGPAASCGAVPNPKPPCPGQLPTRFHWIPEQGGWVWFNGVRKDSAIVWLPTTLRGGFAYFGEVLPTKQGSWHMLIDPQVPTWMRADLEDKLPRITTLYEQWYGAELRVEPQLLFSFSPGGEGEQRGSSAQGGVIDDMVRFTFKGQPWIEDSPVNRQRYLDLVAHEVAHLWNGGMYGHEHAVGASWLHEGNADSMTRRVGLALGTIDEKTFWAERSASLNQCLEAIGFPLNHAAKRHRFDLYYDCGEIIDLAVEGALRKLGKDPHEHWRHMFAHTEREYSMQAYLDSVLAVTGDQPLVTQLARFATEGLAHPRELLELLTDREVTFAPIDEQAANAGIRALILHLHKQDCQGGFSFSGRDRSYVLHGFEKCKQSPPGDLHLTTIAGEPLTGAFLKIYRQVESACETHAPVEMSGTYEGEFFSMQVSCAAPFQFVQLNGWRQ